MSVEVPLKNTNVMEQESAEKIRQQELDFKRASATVEESMNMQAMNSNLGE